MDLFEQNNEDAVIALDNRNGVMNVNVHFIGKLDRDIYKCVTTDIITDDVIITDTQIQHIKKCHPNDYECYSKYFPEIIKNPDYILKDERPFTAMVMKEIIDQDTRECFRIALRLVTSSDDTSFKNSIITFLKVRKKEYNRLIRNKTILYKRE